MSNGFSMDRPAVRWAVGFAFWTLVGALYASNLSVRGQPVDWETSLLRSMSQWYLWGLLAALIVRVDKALPVAREALGKRALCHVPLSIVVTTAYLFAFDWTTAWLSGAELAPGGAILARAWGGMLQWHLPIYWGIIGVYGAYDYYRSFQERRLHASELERLLAESRLNALRTQLHPHFLFNALNAISAHVERDPRTARRMIEHLGELLRLSLDHADDQEIPLEDEIAFLERYLAIQKVRFEDRLDVSVAAPPGTLHAMVPTFVLQPIVENAIVHGISPRSDRGSLKISAARENGSLRLMVDDDGPGLPDDVREGVGISNTRERLRRLYGDEPGRFTIGTQPTGGVRVELNIPYRESNGDGGA